MWWKARNHPITCRINPKFSAMTSHPCMTFLFISFFSSSSPLESEGSSAFSLPSPSTPRLVYSSFLASAYGHWAHHGRGGCQGGGEFLPREGKCQFFFVFIFLLSGYRTSTHSEPENQNKVWDSQLFPVSDSCIPQPAHPTPHCHHAKLAYYPPVPVSHFHCGPIHSRLYMVTGSLPAIQSLFCRVEFIYYFVLTFITHLSVSRLGCGTWDLSLWCMGFSSCDVRV